MDDATQNAPRDDATLLALIAGGDQAAMIEFHSRWFPQFVSLATYLTRSAQDGEDVALDAVVRVLSCAASFQADQGSARSWLLTIVRRLAYDLARRKKVRSATSLNETVDGSQAIEVPDTDPTAQERLEARERAAVVQAALGKLTDDDREILRLRDYDGLKALEVARVLGISVEMVGSRLFRARRRFAALLQTDWPGLFPPRGR